jgi:hypothetical protein
LTLRSTEKFMESPRPVGVDVTGDKERVGKPGERAVVAGTRLTIHIPFEGHETFWWLKPSEGAFRDYPMIEVSATEIVFDVDFPDDTADERKLEAEIDWRIKNLEAGVQEINKDVAEHKRLIEKEIRRTVRDRRKTAQKVVDTVAAVGIPIRRREQPLTHVVPVKRIPVVTRPAVRSVRQDPEPELDQKEYDHILEVMRSMASVMEKYPKVFAQVHEEVIRAHFLLPLNGHYEGSATGETFNCEGKTDILISAGNRNVFIAECKFWDGPEKYKKAIDQLLGYLSWRDAKCALVIFNRKKESTAVWRKMHEETSAHSGWKKTLEHDDNTAGSDSRYIFKNEGDEERDIVVTTQLYDVPEPS